MEIAEGTFSECTELTTVVIGDDVEIGKYAFWYCNQFKELVIPESVKIIDEFILLFLDAKNRFFSGFAFF